MNAAQSVYASFGTNPAYETDGIVLSFGFPKFRIRRAGGANRAFEAAISAARAPYARELERGVLDDAIQSKLVRQVFADTIIIGWENVTDREGNPIEFSKAAFLNLMDDLPELWYQIRDAAQDYRNFQLVETKHAGEQLGN